VGLLRLVGAFAVVLAAAATTLTGVVPREVVAPEGWLGAGEVWQVAVLIAAVMTLSAFVGAKPHVAWLDTHVAGSALTGAVSAATSSVGLILLAFLAGLAPRPLASLAPISGRLFLLVGPALVVTLVIEALQRRFQLRR